jgi:hypothetical protein
MIFLNGSVLTFDRGDRICEAAAVRGNRIVFAGNNSDALSLQDSQTKVIDLHGRTLIPGFVDAHCHAVTYGVAKQQLPCSPQHISSIEDLLRSVGMKVSTAPPGGWILGRGYNHLSMKEKRHPTRQELDRVAPNHKVFLVRTCGHLAVANSRTLDEFGISSRTPDPEGGKIDRDSRGEPTGLLYEQAAMKIRLHTQPTQEEIERGLRDVNFDFLRLGITSLHDASGVNPEEIKIFQKGTAEGWFNLRVYFMVRSAGTLCPLGDTFLQTGLVTGFGNERLRLGPYKLILDGAGSSGSAAMKEPYPGDPSNYGMLNISQAEFDQRIEAAHCAGYQIAVHAIGDRAIEMVLESYFKATARNPRVNHRHRIEHCGFLNRALIGKVLALGVTPVLGLPLLYELGDNYLDVYEPERLEHLYPLRSLLEAGAAVSLSSDTPVIHPNPMHGVYFAVTRKTKSGRLIGPDQKVDLVQALRAYTLHGAYASFEERIKGSIEAGKMADLVVLSRDILKTPPEEILEMTVDVTMVDGQIVYEREPNQ